MFDLDKWQEIFSTIAKHKLRTMATAFGVFWGIMMLVILLGAGQGLENGVVSNMIVDATNSVWFFSDRTSLPYKGMKAGRHIQFKEDDLESIEENIEGYEFISPENILFGNFLISHNTNTGNFQVLGTGKDYFNIKIYQKYYAGRKLNLHDNLESRKTCVIGNRVAEILFEEDEDPVGKYINIKGTHFRVVGLFTDDTWGGQFASRIYMPISTFQQIYNPDKDITLFAMTTEENMSGKELEERVLKFLYLKHIIHPDDNQALWTINQEDNYHQVMSLFKGIKSFIWLVGLGTLIAGIVGISNIMVIIVKDRTREFGIRKTLGASPGSIVSMILQESIVITSVAGYIGLLTGIGLLQALNYLMEVAGAQSEYFKNPEINLGVVIAALIILILAGTLAGLFPAIHAARINPVEAIRDDKY